MSFTESFRRRARSSYWLTQTTMKSVIARRRIAMTVAVSCIAPFRCSCSMQMENCYYSNEPQRRDCGPGSGQTAAAVIRGAVNLCRPRRCGAWMSGLVHLWYGPELVATGVARLAHAKVAVVTLKGTDGWLHALGGVLQVLSLLRLLR